MNDPFMTFWGWLTRFCFKLGWWSMGGAWRLLFKTSEVSTRLPQPTSGQKREQNETRRIAGCREVVLKVLNNLGFIAREVISREELDEIINKRGIQPEELEREIHRRIEAIPGIILGTFGKNGFPIKQPFSVRDRHTYIIGKSGSGKTNLIRTMILQDLANGNGIGVLAPELELLTEGILPYIPELVWCTV